MKKFLNLLGLLTLAFLFENCTSGKKRGFSNNDILGHYERVLDDYFFYEDGTGNIERSAIGITTPFTWHLKKDSLIIERIDPYTKKIESVDSYKIELTKDTIIGSESRKLLRLSYLGYKYKGKGISLDPVYFVANNMEEINNQVKKKGAGWLLTLEGLTWLEGYDLFLEQTQGPEWLKSKYGQAWLKTDEGKEYLTTEKQYLDLIEVTR